ncbi:helix-turn-helix transcriptional regulator [Streptomyces carpinensis]|uniref:Helix-turn-helix transcriptional regulator n=1 Tax=Streptomyces carpinensis TaxID=66369 RepID=A0ABV1VWV8_9ACTN|nr:helix-turn-helix transcriptional regulator [Streptomyces carpinensis]
MTSDPHRHDLGEFLKARRAELDPAAVGLPDGGQRRVAGLRREEVAVLAAISTDYYARLEQGRIQPSPSVLESLARVLRLDDDQRAYLCELSDRSEYRPTAARRRPRPKTQVQWQHMIDDMAHTPALVIGPRTEVVAWNAMGAALITDFGLIPEKQRYYIRLLITDPAMKELYADWEGVTRLAIAQMRMHNANNPGDVQLAALVGELSVRDDHFRQWWAAHDVAVRDTGTKHLRHPVVGDLHLDWNAVIWAADPDLQIVVWTAEASTPTHDSLRMLASWAADPSHLRSGSSA